MLERTSHIRKGLVGFVVFNIFIKAQENPGKIILHVFLNPGCISFFKILSNIYTAMVYFKKSSDFPYSGIMFIFLL